MEFDVIGMIKEIGFPGAVTIWFMWYTNAVTKPMIEVMSGVKGLLQEIKQKAG